MSVQKQSDENAKFGEQAGLGTEGEAVPSSTHAPHDVSQFTQQHAIEIANKLGMSFRKGRKTRMGYLPHEGREIVRIGIRRASKQVGHDFSPKQLYLTTGDCKALHGGCTITKEDYLKHLRDKGLLPE